MWMIMKCLLLMTAIQMINANQYSKKIEITFYVYTIKYK